MNQDNDLSWYLLRFAYHAVNVALYFLLMICGILAGYFAWLNFGQPGLMTVIVLAAYLRLHHDIRAIRRGDVDLPPEYRRHVGDGRDEDEQEPPQKPFGKSGR
ncbi:hypothetical protein [Salaquimonas pukyongi]|uniref:hypothetical protein n=1 Tax=Salaquimonas pukyongi TaxID=2712698 RepID=UPI00096B7CA6|nr:hypothetical protein [Salaquimonas pukyongi]